MRLWLSQLQSGHVCSVILKYMSSLYKALKLKAYFKLSRVRALFIFYMFRVSQILRQGVFSRSITPVGDI